MILIIFDILRISRVSLNIQSQELTNTMIIYNLLRFFEAIVSLKHLGKVLHQHGISGGLPLDYHAILELQAGVGVASGRVEGLAPPHPPHPPGQWGPRMIKIKL